MRACNLVLLLTFVPMARNFSPAPLGRAQALKAMVLDPLKAEDDLDCPGILWLEHLNMIVGEREIAEAFYVNFLGFVAEPGSSFHLNLGSQQLHLKSAPAGQEHVLTGPIGLAVPSLAALRERCTAAKRALVGTHFDVADHGESLACVCPWGCDILCYEAGASSKSGIHPADPTSQGLPKMAAVQYGLDDAMAVRSAPGIRFASFRVRPGTVDRIGRFYEEIFSCRVTYCQIPFPSATVTVGPSVHLVFFEDRDAPLTDAEERLQAGPGGGVGLHVCVYIADFRRAHDRLRARDLVWTNPRFKQLDTCDTWEEVVANRQFRFKTIIDLETGEPLLEVEHEVRAQRHFQFYKSVHYP